MHVIEAHHLGFAGAGPARISLARVRQGQGHSFIGRFFYQQPPQFPPSGEGQGGPDGNPQQGGYAPPPFGAPAPGSEYGGYGAPPPGYPQGYPPYGPSPQGFPPGYPPGYGGQPPTPPRKKTNVGLIVGIVVGAVLVVCVGCVGLLYAAGRLSGSISISTPTLSGPTATPTPTVLYSDPLTAGATSLGGTQHCIPQSDGLHVHDNFACYVPAGTLTNVDVTVQVKQLSGKTIEPYGIEVRRSDSGWDEFDIDSNSKFIIFRCVGSACATNTRIVNYTASAAISGGLNTTNTLEVRAVGSHFDFYVNGTKVSGTDDTSFSAGVVGLSASSGIEVVYTDLKITKPQSQ